MATIGRTTIGSSTRNLSQNCKGVRVTMPEAASAGFSVYAYCGDTDGAGESFAGVLVDGTDLQTILAVSAIRTDIWATGWYQFSGGDFATYAPASGASIVICVAATATGGAIVAQDDAGLDGFTALDAVASLSPFTWGSTPGLTSDAVRDYSVYMDYTPAGGGGGRTTRNTRSFPLGVGLGIGIGLSGR